MSKLSRSQKVKKLAHAIRAYRGLSESVGGKWKVPPKPSKLQHVKRWLAELEIPEVEALQKIENFRTVTEFQRWISQYHEKKENAL